METGIILAAGKGKRFGTIGSVNKCFFKSDDLHLIEYPIQFLYKNGIEKIIVGVNEESLRYAQFLRKKYSNLIVKLSQTRGTAGCLLDVLDEDIKQGVVLYGDTIYEGSAEDFFSRYYSMKEGCLIGCMNSQDLKNYMAVISVDEKEYEIYLKPHSYTKGLAYVGLFAFNDPLIREKIISMEKSQRGEFEITDLIKRYAKMKKLHVGLFNGNRIDCNKKEHIPN